MAQVQVRFRPRSILRSFHHRAQVQVRFRPRSIFGSGQVQTTQYPQQPLPYGPGLGPTPTTQGPPQPALPSTGQDQLQVMQCQQQLAGCHLEPNQGQRSLQSNVFQSLPRFDSTSLALEHGGLTSDLPESRRSMEVDAGLAPREAGQPQFSRETPAFGGNNHSAHPLVVVLTKDLPGELGIRNISLLVMLPIRFARLRLCPEGEVGRKRPQRPTRTRRGRRLQGLRLSSQR